MKKYLKYIVILAALFWQVNISPAQDSIPLNTPHVFVVTNQPGYSYAWWYTNALGERTDFVSTTNATEEVSWNTEGNYNLFVQAKDANNCLSEVISKQFVVYRKKDPAPIKVFAGRDTTIGGCKPYLFADVSPVKQEYTYSWSPSEFLDDPSKINPVFTPGKTTTYVLTVTTPEGVNAKDTVTITVDDLPTIEFAYSDNEVFEGNLGVHNLNLVTGNPDGAVYRWHVEPSNGTSTNLEVISGPDAFILWDGQPGNYTLYAEVTDKNGCVSNAISQNVEILKYDPAPFEVYAGPDTTIGSCTTYTFAQISPDFDSYKYLWEPAINLDNPNVAHPVFTPGETTTYILTVTTLTGVSRKDTVTITVDESLNPKLEFITSEAAVEQGKSFTHEAGLTAGESSGAIYHWEVAPSTGTTTNLTQVTGSTAEIQWDGPEGLYELVVWATDGNGCNSDTIRQQVEIIKPSDIFLTAGQDTTIGGCAPYQLHAVITEEAGVTYSYLWTPSSGLDNPAVANPIFTPGKTTTFVVTVSGSNGATATDSVKVTVSSVYADAGPDIIMVQGSTSMLDGSKSYGTGLRYHWTTTSGKIEEGETGATPVVSGFGDYYLQVTDTFGCVARDTVNVTRLAHAPVAVDDYDTTAYQREIIIDVLANDTDAENSINPSSLSITNPPFNGTAYVDFDTHQVHYRPNTGFTGSDVFEYRICNLLNQCDEGNVYVFVTDFKFLIPNAFSPNGDGVNDYFEILGIDYYENNSLTIINRWGNKVYEAKGYGISTSPKFWDGKPNSGFRLGDEKLPTGTYYYILELGNGEKAISGSIYLDR